MSRSNAIMSTNELRKFGLVTAGMLVLFFDLIIPWIWNFPMPKWPVIIAVILSFMALTLPASLKPVYIVWMKFAEILGWLNTRIILSLIFFLLFFPLGVIMRIFNDPMRREISRSEKSYRIQSNPIKIENMERPF